MARPSALDSISVTEIERYLKTRRKQSKGLLRERRKLQRQIDKLDRKLGKLGMGGGSRGGAGGRAKNDRPLGDVMADVLAKSRSPMKVTDIADKVLATGYNSNSANFRSIVNQTLIK